MGERRGMKALELWCRRITKGYPGVRITNMTTSWRNGLGFCAIIHHFRPDLIDFDSLRPEDVYKNNALAFETAETSLSVPALLDPQDMVDYEVPDRLSILTYVSQFYQAFVGQQGIPRAEKDVNPQPSPEPTTPSEKHVATSVRQRQPCSVCQLPVFLAERMLIERRLVHRTCFKCARCRSQLSTANYYITEDGQFCCEVCPDEEIGGRVEKTAAVLAHERAVLAGPTDDPLSEDADAVLEREESAAAAHAPGAADSSSSDSESDSAESESESESAATETLSARTAGVAKDGHGDGTGRGGEGSENGVRSERGDVSGESERDATTGASTSSDTAAVATADETKTSDTKTEAGSEETSKPQTSDDDEVELRVSSAPPAPAPRSGSPAPRSGSPPSASSGADGATQRLSLVQQRLQQFKAAERPQSAPRRAGRSSQVVGTDSGEQTPPEESVGEKGEEKDEGSDPAKEESEKETDAAAAAVAAGPAAAESSNPFGDDEDEKEKDELNPFGSDGEEEVEDVTKNKDAAEETKETSSKDVVYPSLPSEETSESPGVESSSAPAAEDEKVEETTVPSVSVTEPTPPKPAPPKEYNPFDEDEDEDEEAETTTAASTEPPAAEVKSEPVPPEEEYPDDLNPFGDDEEEPSPAPAEEKPAKPQSLNPFGDSDEEEGEDEVTPASSAQSTPAKAASGSREINPFEKPPRPPPPTLDRRKLASMKAAVTPPRPPEPPGLVREQRAGSLTSLTSTGKKKRPAPRPPGVESSPSRSQGVSPAHSPSTLRKRHAPPPPPPPVAVTGTPPPAPAPAPAEGGAEPEPEPEPEAHSPEWSKAEKEQDNYTKQVNNLTNKSIQGKYKRRKGPAPLRPKPIKRQVKTLPPKETQTELHDINVRQLELERQGVELEKTIRQLTEQDDKSQKELDSTAPYGLDIEDMILQLFELVNEKNALFRRQAELMYMRRQHRLEEEHAELEYEIRCLMMKADSLKTEMERQREQRLIERLVSVVEQRNEIVTMLEMERIREIQEDATIDHHMAERVGSVEPTPDKKKKKKKKDKKEKKEKEGSSKKKGRDADKDIDEKEQATEKKKSKKIKLKKLFS